jgi:hypothetical protein
VGVTFATPVTYDTNPPRLDQSIHQPWKQPPFNLLKTSPRQVAPGDSVHDSVLARWRKSADYRPTALAGWAQTNIA